MRQRHGSLIHETADLLRQGPQPTLSIAELVLGLSGPVGAASAAVFALLGADSRFRVDGAGVWSLASSGVHLGLPLRDLVYAVVDVETTGGPVFSGHRILEIAIVEIRDGVICDEFQTLVNPGRWIPGFIESLTGIGPDMVADAPDFEYVAQEIADRMSGRVFVAHNVGFDWSFVANELTRVGVEVPEMPRLCTVRMARSLVPGLRRRNLDALSQHFRIPNPQRHRAYGDALVTARILLRLLDEAGRRGVADLESLEAHLRRGRGRRLRRQPDLFDTSDAEREAP